MATLGCGDPETAESAAVEPSLGVPSGTGTQAQPGGSESNGVPSSTPSQPSTPLPGTAPPDGSGVTTLPSGAGGMGVVPTVPLPAPTDVPAGGQPTMPAPTGTDPAPSGTMEPPVPSPVGPVMLSTPSQTFQGQLDVTLSTSLDGAEIRYTVDGTVPTAASPVYSAPLALTETTEVRAQAFVGGTANGGITTGLYIARMFDASSNLPLIVLDSYGSGKSEDKEVTFRAAVMVFEPSAGVASLSTLPTLATPAGYHIRGQSSAGFPQAPYKVEFWDGMDQDADYPVLGMPAESDWALIPPYYDRTLIRNPFVYDLGREMGLQAPRYAFAELYLNYDGGPLTEEDYQGIYWFSETIKNHKDRVDLKQLDESMTALPEISGGYIFKFDQAASEEPRLLCTGSEPLPGFSFGGGQQEGGTCWNDLEVLDPEPLNAEQQTWLTNYIQQFHDGLHATPMADYSAVIDVPSFIDYLIISELTKNVDAYVRSCYYHKDRDGALKAGPLWDYNFALGGVGAQQAAPEGDETGFMYSGSRNVNNWYQRLTTDAAFMAQVRTRYDTLRQSLLSDAALEQRIAALIAPLTEAAVRDFERWPVGDIITSEEGFTGGPTVATWDGQVQVMRDFITQRLAWLDTNLP